MGVKHSILAGAVSRALDRCEGTDGRIARRNARARVLAALRAVRSHLDKEFPVITTQCTVRRNPNAMNRQLKKGWKIAMADSPGLFAAAGVPVKRVVHGGGYRLMVPGWAVAIGAVNQAQLRAAKKSKQLRDAALAQAALLQGT